MRGEKEEASGKERSEFLRFVDLGGGEGRLETAVVTYVRDAPRSGAGGEKRVPARKRAGGTRARGRVRVDLVAAVHVADGAYYRELQRRFEGYDAVLYELVKPEGAEPVHEPGSGGLLEAFQRGLKEALGLDFQLDVLDYRKANFVHADLDAETFFRLQAERGETPVALLWKAVQAQWKLQASGKARRDPGLFEILLAFTAKDSARALKYLLARQMEGVELSLAGIDSEAGGTVILAERNKAALSVLERSLRDGRRRLAVFYGAGHMSDLERRLVGIGFRKVRSEWLVAWDIRKRSVEATSGEEPASRRKAGDSGG